MSKLRTKRTSINNNNNNTLKTVNPHPYLQLMDAAVTGLYKGRKSMEAMEEMNVTINDLNNNLKRSITEVRNKTQEQTNNIMQRLTDVLVEYRTKFNAITTSVKDVGAYIYNNDETCQCVQRQGTKLLKLEESVGKAKGHYFKQIEEKAAKFSNEIQMEFDKMDKYIKALSTSIAECVRKPNMLEASACFYQKNAEIEKKSEQLKRSAEKAMKIVGVKGVDFIESERKKVEKFSNVTEHELNKIVATVDRCLNIKKRPEVSIRLD